MLQSGSGGRVRYVTWAFWIQAEPNKASNLSWIQAEIHHNSKKSLAY